MTRVFCLCLSLTHSHCCLLLVVMCHRTLYYNLYTLFFICVSFRCLLDRSFVYETILPCFTVASIYLVETNTQTHTQALGYKDAFTYKKDMHTSLKRVLKE